MKNSIKRNLMKKVNIRSLRAKITILALLASFIPLLLSSVIRASISMKSGKEAAYDRLQDKTQGISSQVSEYVNKAYAVVESLSYSDDIVSLNPAKRKSIQA